MCGNVSADDAQNVAGVDGSALGNRDGGNGAVAGSKDLVLHLHGLEDEEDIAGLDRLTGRDLALLVLATAAVTALFGWLLAALDTPNLGFSILSVATSFLAAALTMLRSSYYGLGYAANDIVLVVLWVLASCEDPAYIPVAVNFGIFLFHDFYGFLSWKKRERLMAQTA